MPTDADTKKLSSTVSPISASTDHAVLGTDLNLVHSARATRPKMLFIVPP
jgi:hypothetical protein